METLREIDSHVAELLKKEKVIDELLRLNPGIDRLIEEIIADQFPRFKSRYNTLMKGKYTEVMLLHFRQQLYEILSALIREAKIHNNMRLEFNAIAIQRPESPLTVLHSDAKYEEALSFFQYHGFEDGFEGDLLLTD